MLTGSAADELHAALEALEGVIGLRIAEREAGGRTPTHPSPERLLQRRLGQDGSDGIPPLSLYRGTGPLAQLIDSCHLDATEALMVVAAIAPEVDEKFARYYQVLSDRGPDHLTGETARNVAARTFLGRLRAAELLGPVAPLRAMGILHLEPSEHGRLAGRLRPDRDVVTWILGQAREDPAFSADFPASRLTTVHDLEDVVAPTALRTQLQGVLDRITHRRRVVDEWGFGQHHDNSEGVVVLFHGPSGTGKTMAAAVLAKRAGIPAYRIDLSNLVSKYIGETEKNLARIFDRAERERCLLVFDEADAVFGMRTDVKDAHDRYANQEVSYLLQRIETHPGVVILATNLRSNIDEAFRRRIHIQVEFQLPSVTERESLWRRTMPPDLPVDPAVDFGALAEAFELTGAEIRNAGIDAAYRAAADGQVVDQPHLVSAIKSQYAQAGRSLPPPSRR